jgi:hypothetical protein
MAPGPGDADDLAQDVTVPIFTDAACGAMYQRHNPEPGVHVEVGTTITWNTNPPSSGAHFPIWARWGVHNAVLPRGHWVHNLEHGGVAVLYRCDGDCTNLRRQLENFVRSLPPEPVCLRDDAGVARRVLLTEDPLLDRSVTVAAAAWGYTYRARCFDRDSLEAFVLQLTGRGPEDFCSEGSVP